MGLQSVSTKHELSCVVNSSQGLEAGEYLKLKNTFVFEYELFQIPRKFANVKLKGNKEFEMFLGHLLIAIIDAKRNDPEELELVKNAEKATSLTENLFGAFSKIATFSIPFFTFSNIVLFFQNNFQ